MLELFTVLYVPADIPGTEYRLATISGSQEGCQRAKRMVEEIVAEVMLL